MSNPRDPAQANVAFINPAVLFAKDAAERAVKTAAQAIGAYLIPDVIDGQLDFFAVNWSQAGSFALGAAALSLLFSLGSKNAAGNPDSASLIRLK